MPSPSRARWAKAGLALFPAPAGSECWPNLALDEILKPFSHKQIQSIAVLILCELLRNPVS